MPSVAPMSAGSWARGARRRGDRWRVSSDDSAKGSMGDFLTRRLGCLGRWRGRRLCCDFGSASPIWRLDASLVTVVWAIFTLGAPVPGTRGALGCRADTPCDLDHNLTGLAGRTLSIMLATAHELENLAPVTRRLASFTLLPTVAEPLFRDWLVPHKEALFRWVMGRCGHGDARRELAESAVAIQRLRGQPEFVAWLYGAALQAAQYQPAFGVLREADLAGLAPELRSVLRLMARGELRLEEAMALLAQRIGYVRGRLLQTRLKA